MKKKYISPIQKVHVLSHRDAILADQSVVPATGDNVTEETNPEDNPLEGDARSYGSGSTNIWDNEW